jgi:isocitrate dehydrogenase
MAYTTCTPPAGEKITISNGKLTVPANPVVPFIRGDGTGPDIWASSVRVFDAAVEKAYGGERKVSWLEVSPVKKSFKRFNSWLPEDTITAFKEYLVGIKGPLTTPVGGGIRSLQVALRQLLDLYVCPAAGAVFHRRAFTVKRPEAVEMVIFRENPRTSMQASISKRA